MKKINRILSFLSVSLLVFNTYNVTNTSALSIDIEKVNFVNNEISENYRVFEDKNEVFRNDRLFGSDYVIMASDSLEDSCKKVYVIYRLSAMVQIKIGDDSLSEKALNAIYDVLEKDGILIDEVKVEGPDSGGRIWISSDQAELITGEIIDKLYNRLHEDELATSFLVKDSCYSGYEIELSNFLKVNSKVDMEIIKSIVSDNKFDVNVTLDDSIAYEDGTVMCALNFNSPATAAQYVELYELINDKVKATPNMSVYFSPIVVSSDFKELNQGYQSDGIGDFNSDGKIDVTDLSRLSIAIVDEKELTEVQQKSADVDGDGKVTLADLARLRQYLSKVIDKLN